MAQQTAAAKMVEANEKLDAAKAAQLAAATDRKLAEKIQQTAQQDLRDAEARLSRMEAIKQEADATAAKTASEQTAVAAVKMEIEELLAATKAMQADNAKTKPESTSGKSNFRKRSQTLKRSLRKQPGTQRMRQRQKSWP